MHVFLTSAFGPACSVDLAVAAERAGLSGVWLAEHHFVRYGQCPSATQLAFGVATRTRRIVIGTAACVFSARHPVALAEEAAMVESLAPGRFRLGVARGGPWVENLVFGGGVSRYEHGFVEWLDSLTAILASGSVPVPAPAAVPGLPGVVPLAPRVVGAVPVRVAATSGATVDLAGVRGIPLLIGVEKTDAEVREMVARWTSRAGVSSDEHARVVLAYPRESRRVAERELRVALPGWLDGIRSAVRILPAEPVSRDHLAHLLAVACIGTPEEVFVQLQEKAAGSGVATMLAMIEAGGSVEVAAELIEALGTMC